MILSWKIWKGDRERAEEEFKKGHEKGLNLSDWNSAFSHFASAYQLYNRAGDQTQARVSLGLTAFSKALSDPHKFENWSSASTSLKALGKVKINVTTTVSAELLSQECDLKTEELKAWKIENLSQRAEKLEEVAKGYLSIAKYSLLVPLLLEKKQISGQAKAHRIIGEAAKLRGDEIADLSPKEAGEFYKKAAIHMKTAGELEAFRKFSEKATSSSVAAQCYFCGREVHGKEINFVYMKANLTRFLGKQTEGQVLPSTLSPNSVVACRGCHSAITIAADEIAKKYFDVLDARLSKLTALIEERFNRVESRIRRLEGRVK